jgi:hypothetical protein
MLRAKLVELLTNFESELRSDNLRSKVLSLVPAFHILRDLGSSLIHVSEGSSARNRILSYFTKYPYTVIRGDELMVVSGIGEWARRVRELRVQFGWPIVSGVTAREMSDQEDLSLEGVDINSLAPDEYVLLGEECDREAAHRWHTANEIRRREMSVRSKLLEFLRQNVGTPVTGEELRYVANNRTEWARRVRELRTEFGWPVTTRSTGRPDLPVGTYVLEQDRQSPRHDRNIPDPVRRAVLVRDKHQCTNCEWSHPLWNPSDPRHLELHHIVHHVDGGPNIETNLTTLCTVCHDEIHSREKR